MEVKEPKTFKEQLNKLKERGCIIGDENYALDALQHINYYRLTAYFLPYRKNNGNYIKDITFNKVHRIYEFDRKLRILLLSIIEEIELMLRTQLSYYHSHKYGALGYMDENNYNKRHNHKDFIKRVERSIDKNKNQPFVAHHIEKYNSSFPLWVIIELFTTNDLSIFYADMPTIDRKAIALNLFGTTYSILPTWLHCLTILRNYCAHYSRLYYTIFPIKPLTPLGFSYNLWQQIFDYILVLKFLYPYPEKNDTAIIEPLKTLIYEYSDCINLNHIGFPTNWNQVLRESVPKREKLK